MTDDDMRFSDIALLEFHQEFRMHVARFNEHEANEQKKFNALIDAQKANTEAIHQLTESVKLLVSDTKDIIQLHNDVQGTIRIGSMVKKFALWIVGLGGAVAVVVSASRWLGKYF